MRRLWLGGAAFGAILGLLSPVPAEAWDRGEVRSFATIPTFAPSGPGAACPNGAKSCSSDVEGVAVAPDGTVYSASYGFNSDGALGGYGELFVFAPTANSQPISQSSGRARISSGWSISNRLRAC
jgi:hypothetical protein